MARLESLVVILDVARCDLVFGGPVAIVDLVDLQDAKTKFVAFQVG